MIAITCPDCARAFIEGERVEYRTTGFRHVQCPEPKPSDLYLKAQDGEKVGRCTLCREGIVPGQLYISFGIATIHDGCFKAWYLRHEVDRSDPTDREPLPKGVVAAEGRLCNWCKTPWPCQIVTAFARKHGHTNDERLRAYHFVAGEEYEPEDGVLYSATSEDVVNRLIGQGVFRFHPRPGINGRVRCPICDDTIKVNEYVQWRPKGPVAALLHEACVVKDAKTSTVAWEDRP